ncbi:hypothetical protein PoMZ_02510 [Pyricularia oryzae]|uniref:Uncharacterized protein n=1 Tax=Pyricularia oryzae TaxID=318829 RepID=A0A4P7N8I4_PYROR|nr:hypothetical protein PoMZ_02510 [Pyricularia oryzae]
MDIRFYFIYFSKIIPPFFQSQIYLGEHQSFTQFEKAETNLSSNPSALLLRGKRIFCPSFSRVGAENRKPSLFFSFPIYLDIASTLLTPPAIIEFLRSGKYIFAISEPVPTTATSSRFEFNRALIFARIENAYEFQSSKKEKMD